MRPEERLEQIRLELLKEYSSENWEKDFTMEIILVSRELGIDIDKILEWTIMRYNVVRNCIAEIYKKEHEAVENALMKRTLW